jgi:hypothetical protein
MAEFAAHALREAKRGHTVPADRLLKVNGKVMGTFTHFSDDEWAAILATRAWPSEADLQQMRLELENAGRFFWLTHTRRRGMSPSTAHPRLKRALKHLPPDPRLRARVEAWLAYYEALSSKLFKGQRNEYRETLYWRILRIWSDVTGETELAFSRGASDGAPRGALIRFMAAVLGPILGDDAPTLEGLVKIIRRKRTARESIKYKHRNRV